MRDSLAKHYTIITYFKNGMVVISAIFLILNGIEGMISLWSSSFTYAHIAWSHLRLSRSQDPYICRGSSPQCSDMFVPNHHFGLNTNLYLKTSVHNPIYTYCDCVHDCRELQLTLVPHIVFTRVFAFMFVNAYLLIAVYARWRQEYVFFCT